MKSNRFLRPAAFLAAALLAGCAAMHAPGVNGQADFLDLGIIRLSRRRG